MVVCISNLNFVDAALYSLTHKRQILSNTNKVNNGEEMDQDRDVVKTFVCCGNGMATKWPIKTNKEEEYNFIHSF